MKKLSELTPAQLILLQKHIELDKDHLITILGKKQFQELLQLARPNEEVINQIKADDAETSGNLIMAVNTIITGCFGGWMGFSAAMEFNHGSPFVYGVVFSIATVAGAGIGCLNFRFVKQSALQAIQSLQLLQLTIEILREIHKKREQELHEIREGLQDAVRVLSPLKTGFSLSDNESYILEHVIDDKVSSYQSNPAYGFLKKEIELIKVGMKKNFEKGVSGKGIAHPDEKEAPRELPSIIEQLIYFHPQQERTSKSWFKPNTRKILISLIPAILGGFGSSFVYFSSSIQAAKAFENDKWVLFLMSPEGKLIKLAFAICMTLYFGFSFLYTYKKNYKRNLEIEKGKKTVIKMESALTILDEQLFKFRQVLEDVEKIQQIFQIADAEILPEPVAETAKK